MTDQLPNAVQAIVETFSQRAEVGAIALGGSRATALTGPESDYDIYVYVDADIPLDVRCDLAIRFDPQPEIGNSWFGPCDEWTDPRDGTSVDVMYWDRLSFERDLRTVIEGHRPALGYSTAFWHTVSHSLPLHDRDGWFASLQELAARPYPEPLRRAIVAWNWPLLRTTHSSYRRQIELALGRDDPVSVQHRLTALLASVFDILFAVNRTPHPGEKRLLDHIGRLEHGADLGFRIEAAIRASVEMPERDLLPLIDALCDEMDDLIRECGLEHAIDSPVGDPPNRT